MNLCKQNILHLKNFKATFLRKMSLQLLKLGKLYNNVKGFKSLLYPLKIIESN